MFVDGFFPRGEHGRVLAWDVVGDVAVDVGDGLRGGEGAVVGRVDGERGFGEDREDRGIDGAWAGDEDPGGRVEVEGAGRGDCREEDVAAVGWGDEERIVGCVAFQQIADVHAGDDGVVDGAFGVVGACDEAGVGCGGDGVDGGCGDVGEFRDDVDLAVGAAWADFGADVVDVGWVGAVDDHREEGDVGVVEGVAGEVDGFGDVVWGFVGAVDDADHVAA